MMEIVKQKVKGMDKILGKPHTSKPYVPYAMRDNDGDGVPNLLDCEPNNPKEQGFIHRLAARAAERMGATDTAERIRRAEVKHEEREAREENIRRDAKKAGAKVYFEKKREIAIQREEGRAARRAEGFGGAARRVGAFTMKFIDQPNRKGVVTSSISKPSRKKIVTYKKIKGGKYKKVVSYKTVKGQARAASQPKPYTMPNIFGSSTNGSKGGIPNIFGSPPKKGNGGIPKIF